MIGIDSHGLQFCAGLWKQVRRAQQRDRFQFVTHHHDLGSHGFEHGPQHPRRGQGQTAFLHWRTRIGDEISLLHRGPSAADVTRIQRNAHAQKG